MIGLPQIFADPPTHPPTHPLLHRDLPIHPGLWSLGLLLPVETGLKDPRIPLIRGGRRVAHLTRPVPRREASRGTRLPVCQTRALLSGPVGARAARAHESARSGSRMSRHAQAGKSSRGSAHCRCRSCGRGHAKCAVWLHSGGGGGGGGLYKLEFLHFKFCTKICLQLVLKDLCRYTRDYIETNLTRK